MKFANIVNVTKNEIYNVGPARTHNLVKNVTSTTSDKVLKIKTFFMATCVKIDNQDNLLVQILPLEQDK